MLTGRVDPLRILFLSLEFTASTFSGNGIYAQGQVRALSKLGHQLFVVSAKPKDCCSKEDKQGAVELIEVEVMHWGRLDAGAPFEEYAKGASDAGGTIARVQAFSPDVVLAVDWSALPMYRALAGQLRERPPLVYLNYRVFARTATGQELELVRGLEAAALSESIETVVLSRSDRQYLVDHVLPHSELCSDSGAAGNAQGGPEGVCKGNGSTDPKVLLCALREDMRQLPFSLPAKDPVAEPISNIGDAAQAFAASRPYITSCVRLSQEKEAEHFVGLVEELGRRGQLQKLKLVPVMTGSATSEYAEGLKARLRAVDDSVVILESFMGPSQLAAVLGKTRLNVHSATYDAFGMTIVEAASQGAPSLVHDCNGAVGATDLLRGSEGEVLLVDMTAGSQALADFVEDLLGEAGRGKILRTARLAAERARGWSEEENARKLTNIVHAALERYRRK